MTKEVMMMMMVKFVNCRPAALPLVKRDELRAPNKTGRRKGGGNRMTLLGSIAFCAVLTDRSYVALRVSGDSLIAHLRWVYALLEREVRATSDEYVMRRN